MAVMIARRVLQAVRAEAAAAPDREVCGLLLGREGMVEDHRSAANLATDPRRQFELDPKILMAAHRAARCGGPAVLGHYHSHPSGPARPSAADRAAAAWDDSLWLIVAPNELRLFLAARAGAFVDLCLHPI